MKFEFCRSDFFGLGVQVFNSWQHIKEEEYHVYQGVCFMFFYWHLDIMIRKNSNKQEKIGEV